MAAESVIIDDALVVEVRGCLLVVCVDGNLGEQHKALLDEGEISVWSTKFLSDDDVSSPHSLDD
jgi:hypothetical protein